MSYRVLVTGSEGFVGRHLCAYLAAQGYEVRGCDVAVPPEHPERRACNVQHKEEAEGLIDWCGTADYVIHLAAISFVPEAGRDPARVMAVNLSGTIHLADAVRAAWPDARFLFVSSSEVYGPPASLPVTEAHAINPQNPYAISKAAADAFCRYAHRQNGLDTIVMRPFNHSGPGQSDRFALSSFARQIAEMESGNAERILRVGNLGVKRDFMHIHDVVRAYECALCAGAAGEAYNLCSGIGHSWQGAVEELIHIAAVDVGIEIDPARMRPADVPELAGSFEKFHAATGWEPKLGFGQMLADLLDYWRGQSKKQ